MNLPNSPKGWAIHLSKMLKTYHTIHGTERFPINVVDIAKEYSKQVFPKDPITEIMGTDFSDKFDGALTPNNGKWGIIYNNIIQSKGRINFTLAHELGHYLLHRHMFSRRMCSKQDMLDWQSTEAQIEVEANIFASYLLMPSDDFCKQFYKKQVSASLIEKLVKRYEVSRSAAALRWMKLYNPRAMLVSGKEGFIDWSWSSNALRQSGIYYTKKQVMELPQTSLASTFISTENEKIHKKGIWIGDEEVKEILLYKHGDFSLSLLIYDNKITTNNEEDEETLEELNGIPSF